MVTTKIILLHVLPVPPGVTYVQTIHAKHARMVTIKMVQIVLFVHILVLPALVLRVVLIALKGFTLIFKNVTLASKIVSVVLIALRVMYVLTGIIFL